jgi:hypothetical protein
LCANEIVSDSAAKYGDAHGGGHFQWQTGTPKRKESRSLALRRTIQFAALCARLNFSPTRLCYNRQLDTLQLPRAPIDLLHSISNLIRRCLIIDANKPIINSNAAVCNWTLFFNDVVWGIFFSSTCIYYMR